MDALLQDIRFALRNLRRSPGFSAVAVVTLALGIGATTTIFTAVNGVLLRPLPYAGSDRLVNIWNDLGRPPGGQSLPAVSPADWRDYRARARLFEDFAAGASGALVGILGNLTGSGDPEQVIVSSVSANFFPLLGVRPALGRAFTVEEEVANGPDLVILSHDLWRRRYGGDPTLVGRTIELDGVAHTVVGVMPRDFRLLLPAEAYDIRDADIWVPLQINWNNLPPRNYTLLSVFGRLDPGVSVAQAQAEMNAIAEELKSEHAEHRASNLRIRVVPLKHDIVKHAEPALLTLLAAVGLVLLIACGNVAHLLLARATVRESELAVRAALGASRWAVIRQLLVESFVLAVGGGLLGLAVTFGSLTALRSLRPANLPRLAELSVDGTVLAFALLACVVTTFVFGLVPAVYGSKADLQSTLKSGGSKGSGSRGRHRLRQLLIAAEVVLSVLLLVGAGLLVRSFLALQRVTPGFDAGDVLTFNISMPLSRYPNGAARSDFYRRLEERLASLPGVVAVGASSKLPLTGSGSLQPFAYDEETARNWESVTADDYAVSPGFLPAVDAELVRGRLFTADDRAGAPSVIIIDETLADLAWPGENAVGKRLQLGPVAEPEVMPEVVGVVRHLRIHDLTREVRPLIFLPLAQAPYLAVYFTVEASGDPDALAGAVRRETAALDKDLAVNMLQPMSVYVRDAQAQARFSLLLMGALGAMALTLAAVGIFGVIAYSVSQRTREIGIRLALGETPAGVARMVVVGGMRLVTGSIAVGLLAALVVSRRMSGLLFGVNPADPLTYAGIAIVLAAVALVACYLPARRATRIDPIQALRSE